MNLIKTIPLSRGYEAIVDADMYDYLIQFTWCAVVYDDRVYAQRNIKKGDRVKLKRKSKFMHEEILEAPAKMDIDHINRNGIDNRKCNLRLCTRSQNSANARKQIKKNPTRPQSKYKGVFYVWCYGPDGTKYVRTKPWCARVSLDGVIYHLGYYFTEDEAAEAYNKAALQKFGIYSRPNVIGVGCK